MVIILELEVDQSHGIMGILIVWNHGPLEKIRMKETSQEIRNHSTNQLNKIQINVRSVEEVTKWINARQRVRNVGSAKNLDTSKNVVTKRIKANKHIG